MRHARILLICLLALGACQKAKDALDVSTSSAGTAVPVDSGPAPSLPAATAGGAAGLADATPETPRASVTREKLLALAVASECLRKGGAPPEQSANTMLALYQAHDIDLDTYTREMSRLAGDPAFQADIDAKTRECPAAPLVVADVTEPTAVDAVADSVAADTKPEAVADTKTAIDMSPPETKPVADFSGNWTGQLYGGPPGNLRVTIKGRLVTSAVATFGRISLRLKGAISEKGSLNLGGTTGSDFMRVTGMAQRSGRAINGTWDGVVDRKRSNGRLLLKR